MNTVNENTMKMENLELAAKVRCEEFQKVRGSLAEEVGKVLNRYIAESGVTGYAANFPEWCHDLETLRITRDDGERHEISLYFRRDYNFENHGYDPRSLELNPCTMGSFKRNDFGKIAYYALNGYLALHLGEIEDALLALDWDSFDKAREALRFANNEVDTLKQSMITEEHNRQLADAEKRLADAEKRLAVGTEIVVCYCRKWDEVSRYFVGYKAEKKVVEKMTAKLVWFKDDWKQYKKAEVLEKLTVGIEPNGKKNGYAFAGDVADEIAK